MLTFQDFQAESNKAVFIARLTVEHEQSRLCGMARIADEYDARRNTTINNYVRNLYTMSGIPVEDFTASNNKIASNFFQRLNTQRCMYSLGNGVTFDAENSESIKEKLGPKFDTDLKNAAYLSLIHGVSFGFWNLDRLYVFPVTEFAPLWDENTGALRAGVRYWQIEPKKPRIAVLYEEDGYTKYRAESGNNDFVEIEPKRGYKQRTRIVPADAVEEVVGEENYSGLPIVPLWGSRLHQSTLVGMREAIDSYDLIRSGFANDLDDCAQIYWLLENYGGMSDADLAQFRDRMKLQHIAVADTSDGGKVQPYTQEVPYQARKAYLDHIRAGIYEDFGGLDVHTIAAGATNDHIDAAYQPLDENADDFEYQIIEFVQQILALQGLEATPVFKRNRISNHKEQVEIVMLEAPYLDDETILKKLPNITPDEIETIMAARIDEEQSRFVRDVQTPQTVPVPGGDQ